ALSGCVFSAGTHTYRVVATGQTVAQGTVVADPAFRRVTIAASAPAVTYGEAVRLSGTVERELASPPQEFDDAVDVFARPFEHLSYRLARVTARSEGFVVHWTIEVRPVRRTEYRAGTLADTAVYNRALSAAVAVDVRPAVSVRAAEGRLSVSVRPARAYAGG